MGGSQQPSDKQLRGAVSISVQDLQWAMSAVKPSAMREVAVDVPKVIAPLSQGSLVHSRIPKMVPSKFPEMGGNGVRKGDFCSYFGLERKRQEAKLENRGFPGLEK